MEGEREVEAERELSREALGYGSKTILQLHGGAGSEGEDVCLTSLARRHKFNPQS